MEKFQLFHFVAPDGSTATGIALREKWYDLKRLLATFGMSTLAVATIDQMLEDWDYSVNELKLLVARVAGESSAAGKAQLDPQSTVLAALFQRPGTIFAAGANYRDHVEAMSKAFNMNLALDPKAAGIPPWHFIKAGRAVLAAAGAHVPYPSHTKTLDWEAELAVTIGRRASNVRATEALNFVAGYSCANDLSARDNLRRDNVEVSSPFRFDWIGHKCFNGACPLGPFLTPAEFVSSPESLDIKLWVNGELKQDSNTSNHLYSIAEQIEYLSARVDLFPGDMILTGTPAGVGMESNTFLKRGDVIKVEIQGLGTLDTSIV